MGRIHFTSSHDDGLVAAEQAVKNRDHFQLICLDIGPVVEHGLATLNQLRRWELAHGLTLGQGSNILVLSADMDACSVNRAFHGHCDAVAIKPYRTEALGRQLAIMGFIASSHG